MKSEKNYQNQYGEQKSPTPIFPIVAVLLLLFSGVFYYTTQSYEKKINQMVSIQKYNVLEKRVAYLQYESNVVKNQIIYDYIVGGGLDSVFVLSVMHHMPTFIFDPNAAMPETMPAKSKMAFELDSLCADWFESIPFMFMDSKHDSTWVLNSESYESSMKIANGLRNRPPVGTMRLGFKVENQ